MNENDCTWLGLAEINFFCIFEGVLLSRVLTRESEINNTREMERSGKTNRRKTWSANNENEGPSLITIKILVGIAQ